MVKLSYLSNRSPIFTKFGKIVHFGHLYPVDHKNSGFLKSNMADGRHVKNVKLPCLSSDSIDLHETWHDDAL